MAMGQAYGVADCQVKHVAVIGAGAMGAGIAAQFANSGIAVELLDIVGSEDRDGPARTGIERQLKAGGFMHPDAASLVRPGNIEDHLDRVSDVDWIVEVVIERIDIKRDLYARIDKLRKAGAIVSSNTSTIPRADLVAEATPEFAASFLITHFFNPPRIMRLVELVTAPENSSALIAKAREACEVILGKVIVDCRDTPGFIANRIGCFWIAVGILEAKLLGITPEEADAVMSVFGIPKTGVFGLADLVGLDLIPHVWGSLMDSLPETDAIHTYDLPDDPTVKSLIDSGRFGRKSKAGFFRMNAQKQLETLDFASGDYRPSQALEPKSLPGGGKDVSALLNANDKFGEYARRVFTAIIEYVATTGPEIAGDIGAIDDAMVLGYGWRRGPCQLADMVGLNNIVEWLEAEGQSRPPLLKQALEQGGFYDTKAQPLGTNGARVATTERAKFTRLSQVKHKAPIFSNQAASLWDMGDGVACFEVHSKLNSLAPEVFDVLERTIESGGDKFQALVIGNDDPRAFSAGADLSAMLANITHGRIAELAAYVERGQGLLRRLRFSPFPVVAAMHGLALGGGCELGLHASRIVAHAELNAGLPEVLVGLVPGWGGCTQMLVNAQKSQNGPKGPGAISMTVFETIFSGKRSSSALDARANGILRDDDLIVMGREALLAAAKDVALGMQADGYTAPQEVQLILPGQSGKSAIMNNVFAARSAGRLTDADVAMADALANILTGGPEADVSRPLAEAEIMRLERETLVALAQTPNAMARIEHMLKTGKPLKN